MPDPARAARLWLMLAVATRWVLSVGGAAELRLPSRHLEALPPCHSAHRTSAGRPAPRLLSGFRRGRFALLTSVLSGQLPPTARFVPAPWPTGFPP
jgi:hypothetical protein